ncbi:MAG: hypothetical protein PHI84_18670 [Kiritimatiellae bacterium]|nr:hypothetical protein [Kiritimatiellia bacterium]
MIPILVFLAWLAPSFNIPRKWICFSLAVLVPIAIFYLWIRFMVMTGTVVPAIPLSQKLTVVLATSSRILFSYLGRLIYPVNLSVNHVTQVIGPDNWIFLLSAVIHLLFVVIAMIFRKRIPLFMLGICWFYFAIAPVSNIVPIFNPEADRYLYLPSIGFLLAVGTLFEFISAQSVVFSRFISVAVFILLMFWTGKTVTREKDWYDNYTLWAHELRLNPENSRAMAELAIEANHKGKYIEAEKLSRNALSIDSNLGLARLQLSKSLFMQRRYDEALLSYQLLLQNNELHPHHMSQAWFDTAYILDQIVKNPDKAITAYSNALAIDPFYLGAAINLGRLYTEKGDILSATKIWREALQRFPDNADLREYLNAVEKLIKEKIKK